MHWKRGAHQETLSLSNLTSPGRYTNHHCLPLMLTTLLIACTMCRQACMLQHQNSCPNRKVAWVYGRGRGGRASASCFAISALLMATSRMKRMAEPYTVCVNDELLLILPSDLASSFLTAQLTRCPWISTDHPCCQCNEAIISAANLQSVPHMSRGVLLTVLLST